MYSMQSGSIPRWNADLKICMACINAVTSTKNHLDSVWHLLNHTEHEPNTPFKTHTQLNLPSFHFILSNVNPIWTSYPNMSYLIATSLVHTSHRFGLYLVFLTDFRWCQWDVFEGELCDTCWSKVGIWKFCLGWEKYLIYASWWFQPVENNMIVLWSNWIHFPKQTLGGENQKTCSTT